MSRKPSPPRSAQLYEEPRLPRWWDGFIIVVTMLSLVVVTFDAVADLPERTRTLLQWIDTAVCALFVADFGARLRRAPRRLEFARRHWVDLLGAVPLVDPLRGARIVRLVRIVRLSRLAPIVRRFAHRHEIPVPGRALGNVGVTTLVLWVASAYAFYWFEFGANKGVIGFSDALWWSMTTLSTVGYGDLYPATEGGRVVAMFTMIMGIGLLGAVAATVAAAFIEFRDRAKRGLRGFSVKDHLLILNWNDKASAAIDNFRFDPRHEGTEVVIVADLETTPIDQHRVRFVRGKPVRLDVLRKASAPSAGAAIVLASDPGEPRSDHESALIVASLRRLSPRLRIAVELVDGENRECVVHAGCDAVIDRGTTIAHLLVRSVQDIGVSEVVGELLSTREGSELYRTEIPEAFHGVPYRDYVVSQVDQARSVVGLARGRRTILCPEPDRLIEPGDHAFVVSREPP